MKTEYEKIAEKAYLKYLARGRMDGFDQQDWLEAEQEIIVSKNKKRTKKPAGKATKNKK